MKRQVVFDTETTGLRPEEGHRIIEVGAVELIDGKKTGRTFHSLINPQRHIPEEVVKIHQIDNEKVKDAPTFVQVVEQLLDFIKDSELLIHNADFDIKFMNAELDRVNKGKLWGYVSNAVCTLKLDRRIFPEESKHKLDDICKRFGIDLAQRESDGHGALLDCQLLADCYIEMNKRHSTEDIEANLEQTNWTRPPVKRFSNINLAEITVSEKEEAGHQNFLEALEKKEKVVPIFKASPKMKLSI